MCDVKSAMCDMRSANREVRLANCDAGWTKVDLGRRRLGTQGKTGEPILTSAHRPSHIRHRTLLVRGLSIPELLISLAIVAVLLTATMVATDASFRAYASAAESASTQTATRLVTHRVLTLIRTSVAHGPLLPDTSSTPPVTLDGDVLQSPYLELIDPEGNEIRIDYHASMEELWITFKPADGGDAVHQPLLGGVTDAKFFCRRRRDRLGVWVLERGSMDLTIQPDDDASLDIENVHVPPIRVVASTMPRKLE